MQNNIGGIIMEHPEFMKERQRAEQAEQRVEELKEKLSDKETYIEDSETTMEWQIDTLEKATEKKMSVLEVIEYIKKESRTSYGLPKDYGTERIIIELLKSLKPEEKIVEVEVEITPPKTIRGIEKAIRILKEI